MQRLVGPDEWQRCEELFTQPVPLSFRLNETRPSQTLETLRATFQDRLQKLDWMEAYYVTPLLGAASAAQDVVSRLASAGEIVVQDALSMLPVLALDVQPHQTVLDMCCAPGSKTLQILDALHDGLLVANDLHGERAERAYARAKATRRCKALAVTAVDGLSLPPMDFHRVLLDVPCSSDGTVRKDPKRLRRWDVTSALCRGVSVLAIDTNGSQATCHTPIYTYILYILLHSDYIS